MPRTTSNLISPPVESTFESFIDHGILPPERSLLRDFSVREVCSKIWKPRLGLRHVATMIKKLVHPISEMFEKLSEGV
jgi:hypothetical protein